MADEVKENNKQLICEIKIDTEMMREIIDEKMTQIKLDIQEIRNKAIDEFAERMSLEISESIIGGMLFDNRDNSSYDTADKIVDYVIDTAKKIAEQMKGGGNSDN